jgi:carbonic anhydrase/acetyltransferase-like protein (isoleucine patch superfamily)
MAHGGGRILALGQQVPRLAENVFVAPGAVVIGDVEIGDGASLWFNCVARADVAPIRIGAGTNIQDGSIIHADPGHPTLIGAEVLIGHLAIIHGCRVDDRAFVGMGAIIMTGAVVESGGMLAAGAMLTSGKVVRAGELWAGRPAVYLRDLKDHEHSSMIEGVRHYRRSAERFKEEANNWRMD